jgi:hypothetical protein
MEFVSAFYDFDEVRNYSGMPSYDQFVEPYRASRDVKIPVKPLIVISEGGMLKPLFIVGWASMPLTLYQRRLLMTVIEDAVFSLTDFRESTGEFVCFPRIGSDRQPEVWNRGDFELLSRDAMEDQLAIYSEALAQAKEILGTAPKTAHRKANDSALERDSSQQDLFD